jgi:hypothetical protein
VRIDVRTHTLPVPVPGCVQLRNRKRLRSLATHRLRTLTKLSQKQGFIQFSVSLHQHCVVRVTHGRSTSQDGSPKVDWTVGQLDQGHDLMHATDLPATAPAPAYTATYQAAARRATVAYTATQCEGFTPVWYHHYLPSHLTADIDWQQPAAALRALEHCMLLTCLPSTLDLVWCMPACMPPALVPCQFLCHTHTILVHHPTADTHKHNSRATHTSYYP